FRIKGVLARDYRVTALDIDTLVHGDVVVASPDGGEVAITVPGPEGTVDALAGRVVDAAGRPIQGLAVGLATDFLEIPGGADLTYHIARESVLTDADGRFVLRRVPRKGSALRVDGDDVVPREMPIADAIASPSLEIAMQRRCHFRVELSS